MFFEFLGEDETAEDGVNDQVTGDNSPDSDDGALKVGDVVNTENFNILLHVHYMDYTNFEF